MAVTRSTPPTSTLPGFTSGRPVRTAPRVEVTEPAKARCVGISATARSRDDRSCFSCHSARRTTGHLLLLSIFTVNPVPVGPTVWSSLRTTAVTTATDPSREEQETPLT